MARLRLVGGAAGPTHAAHEALGEDAVEHGGHQIRFRAHVLQPRDGAGRIVGVQRGEDEVAGERSLDGDLRRLEVPDLTDHDDVGILAHDVAQSCREGEPDGGPHGDLVDAPSWYSTGSSMVMIFLSGELILSSAAYRVVVLPDPVGPVTSKMPWGRRMSAS